MWVDVDAAEAPAFGLADELAEGEHRWHAHRKHQLLFISKGLMSVDTRHASWSLPTYRAAWIPADLEHRVRVRAPSSLRTVYFHADMREPDGECAVFTVPPLVREMCVFAQRWGPARSVDDALANGFFRTLELLAAEARSSRLPLSLLEPRTREVRTALRNLESALASPPELAELARAAGTSERTLERRLRDELGLSFRDLVARLRMIRASEQLCDPAVRPTQLAYELGYASPSAFSHAFKSVCGETPTAYAKRVRAGRG
jgi:AraC-like DNA-binding protein